VWAWVIAAGRALGSGYEVVVGFAVDVEIDGSQGLPGIPSRRKVA
jgi:hypothetical protein